MPTNVDETTAVCTKEFNLLFCMPDLHRHELQTLHYSLLHGPYFLSSTMTLKYDIKIFSAVLLVWRCGLLPYNYT